MRVRGVEVWYGEIARVDGVCTYTHTNNTYKCIHKKDTHKEEEIHTSISTVLRKLDPAKRARAQRLLYAQVFEAIVPQRLGLEGSSGRGLGLEGRPLCPRCAGANSANGTGTSSTSTASSTSTSSVGGVVPPAPAGNHL